MPSSPEVIAELSFLSGELAVFGLVGTASFIVLLTDWRASLLALMAQYLLASLLLSRAIQPQMVLVKVITGGMVCSILYLTARRILSSHPRGPIVIPEAHPFTVKHYTLSARFHFRLLAIFLMALITYGLFERYPFPGISRPIVFASYWLIALGCLKMAITGEAFKAGLGLLTFETGFEVLYTALEKGLVVVGLLGIVDLLIALVIAYLASAQSEMGGEEI